MMIKPVIVLASIAALLVAVLASPQPFAPATSYYAAFDFQMPQMPEVDESVEIFYDGYAPAMVWGLVA